MFWRRAGHFGVLTHPHNPHNQSRYRDDDPRFATVCVISCSLVPRSLVGCGAIMSARLVQTGSPRFSRLRTQARKQQRQMTHTESAAVDATRARTKGRAAEDATDASCSSSCCAGGLGLGGGGAPPAPQAGIASYVALAKPVEPLKLKFGSGQSKKRAAQAAVWHCSGAPARNWCITRPGHARDGALPELTMWYAAGRQHSQEQSGPHRGGGAGGAGTTCTHADECV